MISEMENYIESGEGKMKKIAVLGPPGTFCDNAAKQYMESIETKMKPIYYPTIEDAVYGVGVPCDYGIIPIENTLDGFVQRTLDLLLEMNICIVQEINIPVKFSLIANTENVNEIKKLFVQFKANGQCRKFIDSLRDITIVTTESNMESYYKISNDEAGEAAIIPYHMLDSVSNKFQITDVTDSANNYTRFIVIRPNIVENSEINIGEGIKISLYIMPELDRPGILFEILKWFSENNINLVSIMSRPTKKEMGTYNFFIEISGAHKEKTMMINVLKSIREKYRLEILGIYSV